MLLYPIDKLLSGGWLTLLLFLGLQIGEVAGQTPSVQKTPIVETVETYDELEAMWKKQTTGIRVVNFWSTWCKPCVAELPFFEQLNAEAGEKGVEVVLVSLDFPNEYRERLFPFLERKGLKSRLVALADLDYNRWIDRVDTGWGGAIPVTVIYDGNGNKLAFHSGDFETYDDLVGFVRPHQPKK
jgi:thiol-disulfide isomerase/thioredoxin